MDDMPSVPAEGAWLQQKGRSEEITTNWSSRLPGTHPLKSVSLRYRSVRLERLPNSAGISPLKSVVAEVQMCQVGEAAQGSGGISPLKP